MGLRRLPPTALVAVAVAGLFAGGLYLGDARVGDPAPRSAEAEPVAVTPARSEPPVALDEDGFPVDDGTGGTAGGSGEPGPETGSSRPGGDGATDEADGSPYALVPASTADRTPATGNSPTTATRDDGSSSGGGEREGAPPFAPVDGPADLVPPGDDASPHLRFTDPCAGPLPGEGGGEDCPTGMGGSVLVDDDVPAPPPLAITDPWMGPVFVSGAEDRCPVGVDPDGTVHAFVLTNVPATLTLTLDVRGEHHEVTAETSPEERLRFTGRLLDGLAVDGSQVAGVQTCVTFESLPRTLDPDGPGGSIHWYRPGVHGVDDLGNEVAHEPGFLQMRVRDDEGHLDEQAEGTGRGGGDDAPAVDFAAGAVHFAPWSAATSRCPQLGPYQGRLHGLFTSTAPGEFDLAVIDRGRRIEVGSWNTPRSEAGRLAEWIASGEPPSALGAGAVQTCFFLEGIANPGQYYLDVAGESASGEEVSARLPFTITESLADQLPSMTAGRPRTVTSRVGEQVNILVAYERDEEHVVALGLPRNGPRATGDDCTAIEADAVRSARSDPYVDTSASPIPRLDLDPFSGFPGNDDRFDTILPIRVTPGEGGVIDVCVWILSQPDGDFDPTVEQREQIHIESPRSLRIGIDLAYLHASSIDLFGPDSLLPTEARRYRITALNWPGQPARQFPPTDLPASGSWADDCGDAPRCTEPALTLLHSGDRRIPDVTHLRIEEPEHDHVVDVMLPTPSSCLIGRPSGVGGPVCSFGVPEEHYIDLPDNEGTWCITDCHGRRFIQVVVRPEIGPGGPPGPRPRTSDDEGWRITNEGSFDRSGLPLPVVPRADLTLDTPTSRIDNPGERPKTTLVLPFDRPVDVTVVPELHEPVPDTCALPVEQRSTSAAARHTFTFTDLCFGAHYSFAVTAIDPAGGGRIDLPGLVFSTITPGHGIATLAADLVLSDADRMEAREWEAVIRLSGQEVVLRPGPAHRAGCLAAAEPVRASGQLGGFHDRPTLADLNALTIEVRWTACDGEVHRLSGGRSIGLPDLLAGPITYAATDDDLALELTLTATPQPGWPLPPLGG